MKTTAEYMNKDKARAFILMYCARADLKLGKLEIAYIRSVSGLKAVQLAECMAAEEALNDYQAIRKITDLTHRYWPLNDDKAQLLKEIEALFRIDGVYRAPERMLYSGLHSLLA